MLICCVQADNHPSGGPVASAVCALGGSSSHNDSSVHGHESFNKDMQCSRNMTLQHVHHTVVDMEKQR